MTTGQKLRRSRKIFGYTAEDLGELIGRRTQTVCNWELDKTSPKLSDLIDLADVYMIDVSTLAEGITGVRSDTSNRFLQPSRTRM